jgi:hypothetical protein
MPNQHWKKGCAMAELTYVVVERAGYVDEREMKRFANFWDALKWGQQDV